MLPFDRFEGSDALLGPEMRSTGEVMGIARDFPTAFAKAQAAAGARAADGGHRLHHGHRLRQGRRPSGIAPLLTTGAFRIVATRGTARAISRMGVPVERINKIGEGSPHVLDWIERGDVDMVVNTPTGVGARADGYEIRRAAVARGIPCLTTLRPACSAARDRQARQRAASRPCSSCRSCRAGRGPQAGPDGRAWRERLQGEPTPGRRRSQSAGRKRQSARRLGAYRSYAPPTPDEAPEPRARPVRDARRRRALGRRARRAPVPAARLLAPASRRRGRTSLLEDVGPGTRRLGELRPGDVACACSGRSAPASYRRSGRAGRDPGRRRHRCRAAGDPAGCAGGGGATASIVLLGLPRRAHSVRRGRRAAARARVATDDGSGPAIRVAHRAARTGAAARRAPPSYACGPPPMLEAVGAVRERRRPCPAGARIGHGVRLRRLLRLRRAAPGRRLPARVRRRARDRRRPQLERVCHHAGAPARAVPRCGGRRVLRAAVAHRVINGSGPL